VKAIKAVLKSDTFRKAVCWIGSLYIRTVHSTGRWQVVRGEVPAHFWNSGKPFILCFWHGRLLMMPYCWDLSKTIHMLISEHRDGQLIARTVGHFGIKTAAGSSSRGGAKALRTMVKAIAAGEYVGITPDGPRGPRMRASDGIVHVARLSGVPVVPATYSSSRGRVLGSWDRFLVALPFGRGAIVWGKPITVPRNADETTIETYRLGIEEELNAITREADELVGRSPVEPAEIADAPPAGEAERAL